jgi:hypothetical protein
MSVRTLISANWFPLVVAFLFATGCGTFAGWIAQAIWGGLAAFRETGHLADVPVAFLSLLLFGLFAFPYFLGLSAGYATPLLLIVWLPLWLARRHLQSFWIWPVAPMFGAVAGLSLICVAMRIYHPELILDGNPFWVAFRVGGAVGGFSMFCIGSHYLRDPEYA